MRSLLLSVLLCALTGCATDDVYPRDRDAPAAAAPAGQGGGPQEADDPQGEALPRPEPASLEGLPNLRRAGPRYFAGEPSEAGLRRAQAAGVATVIDLRSGDPASEPFDEASAVADLGLRYVRIPIRGAAFGEAEVERFAAAVDAAGEAPLLIHCKSGNRVGALWATYVGRRRGLGVEAALEQGRAAGLRAEALADRVRTLLEASR